MIENKGNYAFTFELGRLKNFIKEQNLQKLVLSSDAGGNLPMFSLAFSIDKNAIYKFLNEGNIVKIGLGKSIKSIQEYSYKIYGDPEIEHIGQDAYMVKISGMLDTTNYHGNCQYISDKLSAIEVIQLKAKYNKLKLDEINIKKSLDSQYWTQFGCSDRRFMIDTMMHADLNKSFPTCSITKNGTFRLYDLITYLKTYKYKYKFTQDLQKERDITYESIEPLVDRTALINDWIGHSTDMPIMDLLTGEETKVNEEVKNILSINKFLPRLIQEEVRKEELSVINDNVHKNYWRAYQKNLKGLAVYSRQRLGITFSKLFRPIEPLDLIYLEVPDTVNKNFSNKYISGNYLVTRNVLTLDNKSLRSYSEISREAFNYIEGNVY